MRDALLTARLPRSAQKPSPDDDPGLRKTQSGASATAWGAAVGSLLLLVGLVVFGASFHWVEGAGTAERDGFVEEAQTILAGALPKDPFRPLLYPLATAGLALVTGNPFASARFVSNLAAIGLVLAAFGLGRRLGGNSVGLWAMALVACNPNLWIFGEQTTTDMLFAALAAASLLSGLAYLERASWQAAASAGLACGAALFTRANAILLLPALAAALILPSVSREQGRLRWRDLGVGVAAAALFVVPHMVLRFVMFGNPLYDENWRNLWWKLHGADDWSRLETAEGGLSSILAHEPIAVFLAGVSQLKSFARQVLPALMGSWGHAILFALAGISTLLGRRRGASYLVLSAAMFTVGIAMVFFAWDRLLLLLLPVAAAVTCSELVSWCDGLGRSRRLHLAPALTFVVAAGLAGTLAVKTIAFKLPEFVRSHPYADIRALQMLELRTPPNEALGGTAPFLGRYLTRRYVALPDAFGEELRSSELYFRNLTQLLREQHVRYLAIGRWDIRDRPADLLGNGTVLAGLDLIEQTDDVAVWRVDLPYP